MITDWRLWSALVLISFWVWRIVVLESPIGLALFATSAILPVAGLLLLGVVRSANESEG